MTCSWPHCTSTETPVKVGLLAYCPEHWPVVLDNRAKSRVLNGVKSEYRQAIAKRESA